MNAIIDTVDEAVDVTEKAERGPVLGALRMVDRAVMTKAEQKKAEREAHAAILREHQTPRGLVTQAKEFHKAAELIANTVGTHDVTDSLKDCHNVFYYLCGHSLELSMKAILLVAGHSHQQLIDIGHDLEKCLRKMREIHPSHSALYDEHSGIITLLNWSYEAKEFEYRMTGARRWPHVFPLLFVVDEFRRLADRIVRDAKK